MIERYVSRARGDWQKGHHVGEDVNEAVEVQREDQVGSEVRLDLMA